ncbi:alkaline phosphatase D family protein [Kytococcus sedentarius]|uniref:alkaline phosphatase D family protein n=1 Tax=Kytococcus sedentarius TaxID=1276 RepID=UPI0039C2076B
MPGRTLVTLTDDTGRSRRLEGPWADASRDHTDGATSFVWTGDTAGQGWGINPGLGGMRTYPAMAATEPDFFIHSGDTIHGDGPLEETVVETDGQARGASTARWIPLTPAPPLG